MKRLNGKLALAVAGVALLSPAAYAGSAYDAIHPYHTGTAYQRIHEHTAPYDSGVNSAAAANPHDAYLADESNPYSGIAGYSAVHPLYDVVVPPAEGQPGLACVGGHGVGFYPNPVASGSSAASIESGGEFMLDRGYLGCFEFTGE